MSVAIIGAGISGSYLARRLEEAGFKVKVYDRTRRWRGCRCAWASYGDELDDLLRPLFLHAEDFELAKIEVAVVNGVEIDLGRPPIIIDKPKLLKELWSGEVVQKEIRFPERVRARLVVNATGIPICPEEFIALPAYQTLVEGDYPRDRALVYMRHNVRGYAWFFPAKEGFFHLGAACLDYDPEILSRDLLNFYDLKVRKVCECEDRIRVMNPQYGIDITSERKKSGGLVLSVGEAAGAVHPISGEGNIPSLIGASLLFDAIKREGVDEAVWRYWTDWISYLIDERYPEAAEAYRHRGRRFWLRALREIKKRGRSRPKFGLLDALKVVWEVVVK